MNVCWWLHIFNIILYQICLIISLLLYQVYLFKWISPLSKSQLIFSKCTMTYRKVKHKLDYIIIFWFHHEVHIYLYFRAQSLSFNTLTQGTAYQNIVFVTFLIINRIDSIIKIVFIIIVLLKSFCNLAEFFCFLLNHPNPNNSTWPCQSFWF